MNLDLLKTTFTQFMNSIRGDNELYDVTDGQFMYFEKNRTRGRPLSNKELRLKKNINKISPSVETK